MENMKKLAIIAMTVVAIASVDALPDGGSNRKKPVRTAAAGEVQTQAFRENNNEDQNN